MSAITDTAPRHLRLAMKPQARTPLSELVERATRLYPDSEYLQREWLRAVRVVRATTNGWQLDRPVPRVVR